VLKEVAEEISLPLAMMFKQSLESGQVPADWRCANVTPIFKKGAKSSPGNYRPVSLTSVVCKLMERLIKDAIMEHVMTNGLLRQTQHGFIPKKSCLSNLLQFYEEVTKIVDEGVPVDIVYLDFAKAFDVVPHERLMIKLKAIGIHEKVLQWIRAWLKQRKQRVVLNGKASTWEEVPSSVVQGSVLGPELFVIYIDDIDECMNRIRSYLNKFADDTKVAKAIHGVEDSEELQTELDNLWSWACKWQMRFNVDKCKIMHTGRTNPKFSYTLNGTPLSITTEERDLGVIITDNLKPSQQCAVAASKGNQILGQIRRGFTCYDKDTMVAIYKQYVRPHLEYAIQAWCPWTQKDIKVLEAVQKRAIRLISGLKGTYEEKLQQVNLTTLEDRRARGDAIETFKILRGFTQIKPETWFEYAAVQEGPQTRHLTSYLPLKYQTGNLEIRRKWFSGRAAKRWNELPDYVRKAKSVNEFKRLYDIDQIKLDI
jgi:ribonuclease P/MRP protein subunit RPP40